jgi:hypothetical protein
MTATATQSFIAPRFSTRLGHLTDPVVERAEDVVNDDFDASLTTIAFIFGNTDPLLLNTLGLQTCMLALYGAGASVGITRQELWELSSEVRKFTELFQLPEMRLNPNGKVLRFVFNHAMQRAAQEAIPFGSRTDLPVGFRLIQLRDEAKCRISHVEEDAQKLRTIAFMSLNPDPMKVDAGSLALAMLAVWSAGARVHLSQKQYQELRRPVELMLRYQQHNKCRLNEARFVLQKADERARGEGIVAN